MNKLVSVIIPTYNGGQVIQNCPESIKNQTYKNIEIIVVDNNSKDDTKKISKKYTKMVYNKGPERSAQRNLGAEKSRGEYLFFIDHDMILRSKVVEQCVRSAKKNRAIIVPEISFGHGFWSDCKAFERSFYAGKDCVEIPRFVDRKLFEEIGKYDLQFTGPEDYAFSNEIKNSEGRIGRIKEEILHDEGKLTLKKLIKKRYYYGKYFKNYSKKYPEFTKTQIGFSRLRIYWEPKKLLTHPILTAGMVFMKGLEFAAHKYGMIKGLK